MIFHTCYYKIETTMKRNCTSKALFFLQITVEHEDYPVFTVFLTIKTSSQNITITLLQTSLKLPWRKIVGGVISLLCNSDVILTLIIKNFHLYWAILKKIAHNSVVWEWCIFVALGLWGFVTLSLRMCVAGANKVEGTMRYFARNQWDFGI